jgi:23S rRNA pseudouridine1911/1915/1917 synthase
MADRLVQVTVDRGDAGRRLDLVLCRHLAAAGRVSRTRVQAWIDAGCVAVNGTEVRRPAARHAAGDVVTLRVPERDWPKRPVMRAESIALDALFEDDDLLAVNKPAGMVVHPGYGHAEGTLMNALLGYARQWRSGERPSLVGRLDKLTSGVIVVAKTRAAHAALQRALASPPGEKDYLAIVHGRLSPARGRISLPLARDPVNRKRMAPSPRSGRQSVTSFERLAATAGAGGVTLVRCRLATGRMHQIRVHLAARGWPIVGDPDYGPAATTTIADRIRAAVTAFPRQALHAWRLAFVHPRTGVRLALEAPIPEDFLELMAATGLTLPARR